MDRVAAHAATRGLLDPDASVLAMVSGGADSMCLLHALMHIHRGRIGVLTVDHGLRPDAAREADAVVAYAAGLGLEAWVEHPDLRAGPALQRRARDARRAAAALVAGREGFDVVATGHTASDQAETVLFRLARGTGRDGAIGMSADRTVVRPLLTVTRDETRAWCRRHGVAFVDDPANDDPRYARSRVRHGLVPALRAVHPDAERAVTRFAELMDDERAVLRPLVDAAWTSCARDTGLDVHAVAALDPAMRRLVVRCALDAAGVPPDRVWVERALALCDAGGGSLHAPGAVRVHVWRGVLRADRAVTPPPPAVLDVPGSVRFGDVNLTAGPACAAPPGPRRVDLRADGPFEVRAPAPGDRIALAGGGHAAVGRLLAAAGVPADLRAAVAIVTLRGRVVWVSGYRADATLLATPGEPATRLELV